MTTRKSGSWFKPKDVMIILILAGCLVLIAMGKDGLVHSTFEITVAVAIGERVHEMKKR